MKLSKLFQTTAIAALFSGCLPQNTVPEQNLEPDHANCIEIYIETRHRILTIMRERDLSYRDLVRFYGVYESDLSNVRYIHPQAYESELYCSVITSPIYYYIYRILEQYPDGRYPDGIPPEY